MWCRAPKRCLSLSRFCFFFFSFRYTASPRHFLEISYQLPAVSCKDNSCWYDYELVNGPCSNDIGNVADTRGRHPPYIITQLHAASFLAASFRDARVCARAIRSGERSRFCPIKRRPWNADDRTHNRGKLKLGMYNRNTVYNRP